MNKHTSEDNASYVEIVEEESAKLEEKANSLYAPSLEYKPALAAIGCKFAIQTLLLTLLLTD